MTGRSTGSYYPYAIRIILVRVGMHDDENQNTFYQPESMPPFFPVLKTIRIDQAEGIIPDAARKFEADSVLS